MAHANLMATFVVVAALALALQAAVMVGIFVSVKQFLTRADGVIRDMRRRTEPFLDTLNAIVQDSREPVHNIVTNLSDVSRTLRERTNLVDARVGEMVETFRLQVARIDQLIATSVVRVNTAADVIQSGILNPVYQASAILKGVQAGIDYFFKRRRSSSAREANQDEELFI